MPEIRTHVKYSVVGVNGLSPSEIKQQLESLSRDCDDLPTLQPPQYRETKAFTTFNVVQLFREFARLQQNGKKVNLESLIEIKNFVQRYGVPSTFYLPHKS